MKRKFSILIALVMAILLCLTPVMVGAVSGYDTKLVLENKDAGWNEINGDGIKGVLWFNSSGYEFEYQFFAKGLEASTDYSLIYYADPWAGDNPGAVIAEFTSNGAGRIPKWQTGSIDLGMSLPHEDDENEEGAKIWLVPTAFLTDGALPLDTWGREAILFERDLITYTDIGVEPVPEPVPNWILAYLEIQETHLQVFMPWGFGDYRYQGDRSTVYGEVDVVGYYEGEAYRLVIPEGTEVGTAENRPSSLFLSSIDPLIIFPGDITFSNDCYIYKMVGELIKTKGGFVDGKWVAGEWVGDGYWDLVVTFTGS